MMIPCEMIPVHRETSYGIFFLTHVNQFVFYCGEDADPFLKLTQHKTAGFYQWDAMGLYGDRIGYDSGRRMLHWFRAIYPSAHRPNKLLKLSEADIAVLMMQAEIVRFETTDQASIC